MANVYSFAGKGPSTSGLNSVEELLDELRAGRMVVVMDDEDRENEGDLLMPASLVRPEDINFMARYGRGLICLTLTRERCRQLRLPLMVSETDRDRRTNFTLSIEAAQGVTTGISAYDRAHTVRTAVAPNASPEDLRQPGHIFPIMAQPGGVLTRAGHTEAGCDLARLAGFEAAAVIVEIMNDDGTMARRPDLEAFARSHNLKIGTIAELIRYRLRNERSVERISEQPVQTEFGEFRLFLYEDHVHRDVHLALTHGPIGESSVPLVRVHVADTLRDLLGVRGASRAWTLRAAMERIACSGSGVIVILRDHESPRDLVEAVRALAAGTATAGVPSGGASSAGAPVAGAANPQGTFSASSLPDAPPAGGVLRTYGVGAQILKDLGIRRMRVLSAPRQLQGISAFDLEIESYVGEDS
jgi:3,4-dihydroxy 2-butanone 4-phosphate synthase/GTP cyclohydrolase II